MKSPLGLLRALLCDIARLEPSVHGLDRDYTSIEARVKHEGFSFVAITLPTLGGSIDYGISTGRFACPLGFKKVKGGALPRLFSGLLCNVFDTQTGHILPDPSVSAVKCLREICYLFKKTLASSEKEEYLDKIAKRSFWSTEECVARRSSYDVRRVRILQRVSRFCLPELERAPRSNLGRHGPGAVVEGYLPNQKWAALSDAIMALDSSDYCMEGFAYLHADGVLKSGHCPAESIFSTASSGVAKVVSVAKNSTSRRTITVEPLLHQFEQQRLNRILRDCISKCGVLSRSLDLTDQVPNQKLAEIGSRTGEWSTIDLSSASDLLGLDLVKLVFADKKEFLYELLRWRTSLALKDGCPTRLNKFAGMGNATTFPVQSLIFAVLCISAMSDQDGKGSPSYRQCCAYASQVRVFGDDIIVRSDYALTVVSWLTSFGLKVNQKKSFLVGNFKESCGMDAFKGYNVTPVYLRRWPDILVGAEDAASVVATANQLWFRGLYSAANFLVHEVEVALKRRLPLVSRNSGILGLHSRIDAMESHGWDPKLQHLITKGLTVRARVRADRLDGIGALLKFYHTPLIERDDRHLSRVPWRYHSCFKKSIVATEVAANDDYQQAGSPRWKTG